MAWTNNLIAYCKTGNAGCCPKCNSEKVDVIEHKHGKRTSLSFSCKDCGSGDHFDGCATK